MRAGEDRANKHIDEVKEIKILLIQVLRLPPPAKP